MKYTLHTPCDQRPFLRGSGFEWNRLVEHASGEFACHKTCTVNDDTGNFEPRHKSPHCAGALIFLEHQTKPHQMMRIAERLGMYDASKLDMDAPVVRRPSECRPRTPPTPARRRRKQTP